MELSPLFDEYGTYLAIGLFALILVFAYILRPRKLSYQKVSLFTPAEINFLKVLDVAVGSNFRVFGKVRIADVVNPSKNLTQKNWRKHFWQVSSKHFDFCLTSPYTHEVLCVIELNDKSHNRRDRGKRDLLVNKVCKSCELPLLWIEAKRTYDKVVIANMISQAVDGLKK